MATSSLEVKSAKRRFPYIAVIDEDQEVRDYVRESLGDEFTIRLFSGPGEASETLEDATPPDLVFLDCHIDSDPSGESAFGLLTRIRKAKPFVPVIMLSCSADTREILKASQMGAAGVLLKPFHKGDLDSVVQQYFCVSDQESPGLEIREIPLDGETSFVRASKRMRDVESHCRLVASTDIPVLILGESGTGKEIAAKLIHKMSPRTQRNFLKVNCAAMPLDLLESELFGYEPGAFTGAVKSKPGKFELCNGGTIFLDEIGEMPTALQAKLLQVLQDGTFSRLGSRNTVKVDVRVIAATNINIKAAMAQKSFREDLYYRLNGFSIHVPPLRERREEIPILAKYFLARNASKFDRESLPISVTLMQALLSYSWPGNLRELDNFTKRYLVLEDEQAIIQELHPELSSSSVFTQTDRHESSAGLKHLVKGLKGDAESVLIAKTLEATGWNRKAAAAQLQISYKALLYKIKQYHLEPSEIS
ncbi:sigma-54-dependent Fis family transcriptional regulator [Acidobacteria bacterium AB60]|nr:sigma-54-dependent Fis family transcriptional regulator [Acidobacteria bacterium AB60]